MRFFNIILPLYLLATAANSAPTTIELSVEGVFSSVGTKHRATEANPKSDLVPRDGTSETKFGFGFIDNINKIAEEIKEKAEDLKKGIYDRKGNFVVTCESATHRSRLLTTSPSVLPYRIVFFSIPLYKEGNHLTDSLCCALVKKETMTIGDIELDDIFESLKNACHISGVCETNEIVLKGQLIGKGTTTNVKNIELSLWPNGDYRERHHAKLLRVLKSAVRQVAKCEDYTHKSPCSNPMGYCPCKLHASFYSLDLPEMNVISSMSFTISHFVDSDIEKCQEMLCSFFLGRQSTDRRRESPRFCASLARDST